MLPTEFKHVVAVSSISGFERTTSIQRCQFSAGTSTLLGTARHTSSAVMPLAMPIAASDQRQPNERADQHDERRTGHRADRPSHHQFRERRPALLFRHEHADRLRRPAACKRPR